MQFLALQRKTSIGWLPCRLPLLAAHEHLGYANSVVLWPKTVQLSNSTKLPGEIYKLEHAGVVVEDNMTGRNNGNVHKIWSTMDTTKWASSSKLLKQASRTKTFPYSRTIPLDKDTQSLQHRAHTKFKKKTIRWSSKSPDGFQIDPNWSPYSNPSLWTSQHVDLWSALLDVRYSLISCLKFDW